MDVEQKAIMFNFGGALDILKAGGKVSREGWNGANQWIKMQVPDEHSKMKNKLIDKHLKNASKAITNGVARITFDDDDDLKLLSELRHISHMYGLGEKAGILDEMVASYLYDCYKSYVKVHNKQEALIKGDGLF